MKNQPGTIIDWRPGLMTLCMLVAIAVVGSAISAKAQDASGTVRQKPVAQAPQPVEASGSAARTMPQGDASKTAVERQPAPEAKPATEMNAIAEKAEPSREAPVDVADEPRDKAQSSDAAPTGDATKTGQKVADERSKPVMPVALVVRSWAGAYGAAQDQAIIKPVARGLDMKIERRTHGRGDEIAGGVDALELDQSTLLAACVGGRLLTIKALALTSGNGEGASGGAGRDPDFIGSSASDCGVPTFAWSSLLVVNGDAMGKLTKRYREPAKLEHLLDIKSYPGKRALIRSPRRLLEMMLIGSGVKRTEVYEVLATRQGQDAAFRTLDGLSKHVVWVDEPQEALQALDAGTVTMAMTYSGRAFRRLIAGRLIPIWDGHIIDYASWAVPVASTNREKAARFIRAATTAERLAAQARLWPYGPMRRSALALATRHDLIDTEIAPFMPTSELRFGQGLLFDASFWAKHGVELQDRFDAWLSGVPLGIRVPLPRRAPPPPLPPLPAQSAG